MLETAQVHDDLAFGQDLLHDSDRLGCRARDTLDGVGSACGPFGGQSLDPEEATTNKGVMLVQVDLNLVPAVQAIGGQDRVWSDLDALTLLQSSARRGVLFSSSSSNTLS